MILNHEDETFALDESKRLFLIYLFNLPDIPVSLLVGLEYSLCPGKEWEEGLEYK